MTGNDKTGIKQTINITKTSLEYHFKKNQKSSKNASNKQINACMILLNYCLEFL